jgi:hypothetical protein
VRLLIAPCSSCKILMSRGSSSSGSARMEM